jgi:hypothetical protein
VLAALSDFRIAFDESFRFETLIGTLRLSELQDESESETESLYGSEKDGIWEARTSAMTLVNAITNCPELLEERIMLREEFGRRGLNEVIVVCVLYLWPMIWLLKSFFQALRYVNPPESLLTQLDVYTEEKFEDEEDMRERMQEIMSKNVEGNQRSKSDSELLLHDLVQLAKQHGELYPTLLEILRHYGEILRKDMGL